MRYWPIPPFSPIYHQAAANTRFSVLEVLAIRWEHVAFETGRLIMSTTGTGPRQHDLPAPGLATPAALP